MNLINKPYVANGNYLCTWETQESVAHKLKISGANIPMQQRNAMNDALVFGEESMYHLVPEKYRGGIYFLLDDGWDVPYDIDAERSKAPFGSVIPDKEKFPNYGDTPVEKLTALSEKVKALGYAGLGLWISPQIPFEDDNTTMADAVEYWSERAKWCHDADVRYWKVDWGKHQFNREYCNMMTDCVKKYAPNLIIEHAVCQGPFHGTRGPEDGITKHMCEIFEVGDIFRTYDVLPPFVDHATLQRLNALLLKVDPDNCRNDIMGNVNIESSPAVAVGLGCNMGIMYGGSDVNAALSWQRLAPPFSVFSVEYHTSKRILTDTRFGDCKPVNWTDFYEKDFSVSAPAVTSRGTRLPEVEDMEIPPYVMACKHPETGAYAVSTLHRVLDPNNKYIALADVKIFPEDVYTPIGIFGYYKNLTVEFSENIPEGARVYAQCLLCDEAIDVTEQVEICENILKTDGKKLRLWGRDKDAYGFEDDPALIIQIVK